MNIKWLCIIIGGLLLIAIPPGLPYSYYQFLRLVVFLSSLIIAYGFYQSKHPAWTIIYGAIAFLFNPISPIYMPKQSWVAIDFISAIIFFLSAFSKKKG